MFGLLMTSRISSTPPCGARDAETTLPRHGVRNAGYQAFSNIAATTASHKLSFARSVL
jgi:hypothetical protein